MPKDSLIKDNRSRGNLYNFLKETILKNAKYNEKSKLKIVSAYFTIYAFRALKDELKNNIEELKFILGEPSSVQNLGLQNKRAKIFKIQDSNIKLENAIAQKKIAKECYSWLSKPNIEIRTAPKKGSKHNLIHGKMYHIENSKRSDWAEAIVGSSNFTTSGLGINGESSNFELNTVIDSRTTVEDLKDWFDELWQNHTEDAKKEILGYLKSIYKENTPEEVYYKTLFHLFGESTEQDKTYGDIEENKKFTETVIWNKLFSFQKHAVKTIKDRLEKYNGCILADSVGLGKTFTALGIIKYFMCTKRPRILVLCPKRLMKNWVQFKEDHRSILKADGFHYTVLSHTDLDRTTGKSGEINLAEFSWDDFDLIVIDESHNFRNATPSKRDKNGEIIKKSRYDRLLHDIIENGLRQPKVLLLTATPVNTNLNDLKNQLRFITLDNDKAFAQNLGIPSLIGTVKKANTEYIKWYKSGQKQKDELLNKFDTNFFNLMSNLTVARSRSQIKTYYENSDNEIGKFPKREKPNNYYCQIDTDKKFMTYEELNNKILNYKLSLFHPAKFLKEEFKKTYLYSSRTAQTQDEREESLIGMMKMGFLKRIESSIASFTISMRNTINKIDERIRQIDNCASIEFDENDITIEEDDYQNEEMYVGKKLKYNIKHLKTKEWKEALLKDREQIEEIYNLAKEITPNRDEKLRVLKEIIEQKTKTRNKKILIFTTFSDTAQYLYKNLLNFAVNELHQNIALVTGTGQESTFGHANYEEILSNFSPKSKKELYNTQISDDRQINILIATDCISEGQNLQDCDCIVNYDIHWNPVRLIQRFGRIDRIGSENKSIKMINFWPTNDLEVYMNLESRVKARMTLADISGTADEDILEQEEQKELQTKELSYREKELKKIMNEEDIEDFGNDTETLSLSDFTLENYKSELNDFIKNRQKQLESMPLGINAITPNKYAVKNTECTLPKGIIFCLKQKNSSEENKQINRLQPFYLVYVKENGEILYTYENAAKILEIYRQLCVGRNQVFTELARKFDETFETEDGQNKINKILQAGIKEIVKSYGSDLISSLSTRRGLISTAETQLQNDNDFELVTWLVIDNEEETRAQ